MNEKQLYLFENPVDNSLKRRYVVVLPLDTIILMMVIFVLLFIFSYSIGVERGKKIVYSFAKEAYVSSDFSTITPKTDLVNANLELTKFDTESNKIKQPAVEPIKNQNNLSEIAVDTSNNEKDKKKEDEPIKNFAKEISQKNKYVIQVASYQNETIAKNELEKLKQQGYPVFISKKGKFIAIFVGEFSNKDTAKKYQQALQKIYNDCLLRTL
ncbi:MAG: SPOR domain-containing protein [Candidatus Omnitrophica bacterium]|nr:SPOR domain-containing protein [Candidatus Omnitrophota bacterium]